jgi:hypothetical protein
LARGSAAQPPALVRGYARVRVRVRVRHRHRQRVRQRIGQRVRQSVRRRLRVRARVTGLPSTAAVVIHPRPLDAVACNRR